MHRLEDERFVTGQGCYVDDVALEGQCYLHAVRSPHAHAAVSSIDIGAARAVPGVLAVLAGADMRG